MSRSNEYYDKGRTYEPLYEYYLPENYIKESGYYSDTYDVVYYDGYGYNFYYGDYAYYEFSQNEEAPTDKFIMPPLSIIALGYVFGVGLPFAYWRCDPKFKDTLLGMAVYALCYIPTFCDC